MKEEDIFLRLLMELDGLPNERLIDFVEEIIGQLKFIYHIDSDSDDDCMSDVWSDSDEEIFLDEELNDLTLIY
jgi:hypothetical protein